MKKYLFIVSDGETIRVLTEKPKGVEFLIGRGCYFEESRRTVERTIGQTITVYTDSPWVGVIGIYDTADPLQMFELAKGVRDHTASLAGRLIERDMTAAFGQEAASEVGKYRYCSHAGEQREFKWSPLGKLLWDLICAKNARVNKVSGH